MCLPRHFDWLGDHLAVWSLLTNLESVKRVAACVASTARVTATNLSPSTRTLCLLTSLYLRWNAEYSALLAFPWFGNPADRRADMLTVQHRGDCDRGATVHGEVTRAGVSTRCHRRIALLRSLGRQSRTVNGDRVAIQERG